MSTKQATAGHPEALFILSGPPRKNYTGKEKVALWYFTNLREAVWGVLNGDGNGRVDPADYKSPPFAFGRLTYLQDGPTVDLSELVADAHREHVLELRSAGIAGYGEWDLPMARMVDDADKKTYNRLRKAAADRLEARIEDALRFTA